MPAHAPRLALLALCLSAVALAGLSCPPKLNVLSPTPGSVVTDCDVSIFVAAAGTSNPATLTAELNGVPVALEPDASNPRFQATLVSGPPLAASNTLVLTVQGSGGGMATQTVEFDYAPTASARQITSPGELIGGALAQGKVGDWLLEGCGARFVVQDAGQRDLHSVGQYGGNVIDAEVRGRPDRDQFFEFQPTLNAETVVNAQTVEVVNDGANGQAAVLRSCGPDDLLDYVNPSTVAADFGFTIPPDADDHDQDIEACTEYTLGIHDRHLRVETFVSNFEATALQLIVGDYLNGMGSLEQWTPNAAGIGEIALSPAPGPSALSQNLFGFGSGAGVDYTLIPVEYGPTATSSFTQSGVTFVAQGAQILLIFLGFPGNFAVPAFAAGAPGTNSFVRYFGVGDGSPSNAVDLRSALLGLATGTLEGCVTVGGDPAPGARVAVGPTGVGGAISKLATLFVTGDDGCYQGTVAPGSYGAAASLAGTPFVGGGPTPPVTPVVIADGVTTSGVDFALPTTGRLEVTAVDEASAAVPARVTVVGFDPSPEPKLVVNVAPFGNVTTGLFRDVSKDGLPFGVSWIAYTGSDGAAAFDLEPGTYQIFVSRGTEYSSYDTQVTVTAGATSAVVGQIARVIDTSGFISSDYHVHMLNSPDSRVGFADRVRSFAGEGVDNIIATDHDAHTDLLPTIASLGFDGFVTATVGEEITSFDFGHFNGYPQALDASRPSGGSTDWAGAAPPGMDFPSYGNYTLTPAGIANAAEGNPLNAGLETVVQVNHIDSHYEPLKIDSSAPGGPTSMISDAEKAGLRFCSADVPGSCAAVGNVFHHFAGLELWNGASAGSQSSFLDERIGIWMNQLNQGLPTTAIADTDTHTFNDLEQAGARTWTPSSTDAPELIDPVEIPQAVRGGQAVGGQGVYVQARLLATDGSAGVADFTLGGDVLVPVSNGEVDLEITVQAPLWAEYDSIEVYRNATTCVSGTNGGVPVLFSALPTDTLSAGIDFTATEVTDYVGIPGAGHRETQIVVPYPGLTQDTWFAVLVRGTPGVSEPMFPIYPRSLASAGNATLANLLDGNLAEGGTLALGFTNALYVDVDGGGFDAPGIALPVASCP